MNSLVKRNDFGSTEKVTQLEHIPTPTYQTLKAKYLMIAYNGFSTTPKVYYEAAMAEIDDAVRFGYITEDEQIRLHVRVGMWLL